VGWMLREDGKKDLEVLEYFLKNNYKNMKRVTLRYAIERFPKEKQKYYLSLV
jgi:3-methyladenine DNA glycosylase AlkD